MGCVAWDVTWATAWAPLRGGSAPGVWSVCGEAHVQSAEGEMANSTSWPPRAGRGASDMMSSLGGKPEVRKKRVWEHQGGKDEGTDLLWTHFQSVFRGCRVLWGQGRLLLRALAFSGPIFIPPLTCGRKGPEWGSLRPRALAAPPLSHHPHLLESGASGANTCPKSSRVSLSRTFCFLPKGISLKGKPPELSDLAVVSGITVGSPEDQVLGWGLEGP